MSAVADFFAPRSKVGGVGWREMRGENLIGRLLCGMHTWIVLRRRSTCANELPKTGFYALSTPWNEDTNAVFFNDNYKISYLCLVANNDIVIFSTIATMGPVENNTFHRY